MGLLSSCFYILFLIGLTYQVQITVARRLVLVIYVAHHLVLYITDVFHVVSCASDV